MSDKNTIAGLISQAAKKLRDDFEYIRNTNPHAGEKGGECSAARTSRASGLLMRSSADTAICTKPYGDLAGQLL
jgi:hypothetical protein